MSIVAMKRVLVLAPADCATAVLEALQLSGTVHLVPAGSAEPAPEAGARASAARRVEAVVRALACKTGAPAPATDSPPDSSSGAAWLERAEAAIARRAEAEGKVAALAKELRGARPFGALCQRDFDELAARDVTIRVYAVNRSARRKLDLPREMLVLELPAHKDRTLLVTAARGPGQDLPLERLDPPARTAAEITVDLDRARARLAQSELELARMSSVLPAITEERIRLVDAQRLAEARARAHADPEIFAVTGWCPARVKDAVASAVTGAGGAASFADPDPDEEPPVELANPGPVGWFEPLLQAFQLPRYREPDPTILFAPFMAVFFGFCLGDAAYGLLLFGVSTVLRRVLGLTTGTWHKAFRMMQLLGLSTVVVGLLIGRAFGHPLYQIAALRSVGLTEDRLLFFLSEEPQRFFYAALLFGAVQLGIGIGIRLVLQLRHRRLQEAIGTVGWLLLLPAVPIWLSAGSKALFLTSLALIVLFRSPGGRVLQRFGGGLWGLYQWVLGLFGDVMSYLRIFGLGLSSGIIAQVVNTIAALMLDGGSLAGTIGGVLILLIGHTFNFAMAVLGATVHSARLQFLEYFGKFFEGGGQPFTPFERSK